MRMTKPGIPGTGNDRTREWPNPGTTEPGKDRTREFRTRDSRSVPGFGECLAVKSLKSFEVP
jgi:hypothetical protein